MKTLNRVEQIELERSHLRTELKMAEDELERLHAKIDYVRLKAHNIAKRIDNLDDEEEEIYKLSVIEKFKEFAASKYPNGYTIYFVLIKNDFSGDSKCGYVIRDNSVNPNIFEEMFKDMIEGMSSEIGLKIVDYYYKYNKVELEDLSSHTIKRLMQKYS